MRQWKMGKGQKVGMVGLGGLRHMGVKFTHALGAHVVLFATSPNKTADADELVISKNAEEMQKHAASRTSVEPKRNAKAAWYKGQRYI
jgi:uncharacterized zinc-type alcohol dehydrogenase-like protein